MIAGREQHQRSCSTRKRGTKDCASAIGSLVYTLPSGIKQITTRPTHAPNTLESGGPRTKRQCGKIFSAILTRTAVATKVCNIVLSIIPKSLGVPLELSMMVVRHLLPLCVLWRTRWRIANALRSWLGLAALEGACSGLRWNYAAQYWCPGRWVEVVVKMRRKMESYHDVRYTVLCDGAMLEGYPISIWTVYKGIVVFWKIRYKLLAWNSFSSCLLRTCQTSALLGLSFSTFCR